MKHRPHLRVSTSHAAGALILMLTVMAAPAGAGDGPEATTEDAHLLSEPAAAVQTSVLTAEVEIDGQPQSPASVELTISSGPEGASLPMQLAFDGPIHDTFSFVIFTSGKGEDFRDGGQEPTATGGSDYFHTRRTFSYDGTPVYGVTVPTYEDGEIEGDEWFMVIATNVSPNVSFDVRGRAYIYDTTPSGSTLDVDDVTVTEGDSGTTDAVFTVTLSPASSSTVTVDYTTCGIGCHDDATAAKDEDYVANVGSLTFAPGETSKTVPVAIKGDTKVEDDEIFFFGIGRPENAELGDNVGVGTILNDDVAAPPGLTVDDVTVDEGDTGTSIATFTVTASPTPASPVTVDYGTCGAGCGGTADFNTDYNPTSGTLTFGAGETSKRVDVEIVGDTDPEPDETFYLLLQDAVGATIDDDRGLATIVNDDVGSPPTLSVDDVAVMEGDTGTSTATFTVSLTPAASSTVTVDFSTCGIGCNNDATAMKGEDYGVVTGTLAFAPGETSKTIDVPIYGDTYVEPDEYYYMNILNPVGATRERTSGLGTILNDDTSGNAPLCNGLEATIWGSGLLIGTAGNDVIAGSPGPDEIRGGDGDDVLCGFEGDDKIIGGLGNDQMWGGPGADLIKGLPGDDTMYGGPGNDRLQGNAGIDVMQGDDGKDKMWGGIGPDLMSGGPGNDQIHGNPGGDGLMGGPGTDRMWGEAGNDSIRGGDQSDFLYGGIGADTLEGEAGNDRIFGWHGNDLLYGNEGRDQLRGQQGDDMVDGGPGYDYCSVELKMVDCDRPI